MKSSTCQVTKDDKNKPRIARWSVAGRQVVKVPNDPAYRDQLKNLRDQHGEPMATYFSPTGHVLAWQWRLP